MSAESPVVILYDSSSNPIGSILDGAIYRIQVESKLVASGAIIGSVNQGTSPWIVDGSAVTQPISAVALPLPTGASQEHVLATSPSSIRLSDGAAFYDAAKTGQFPAALITGRLDVNVGASILPTGAATEGTLSTRLTEATFIGRINTLGQKAMAASTPIVIASDQSAIPISGTITANSASTGVNNAAAPGSSTQVGGTDGTNLQAAHVHDLDSGVGTEYNLGLSWRLSSAGGSVEGGTSLNPLRTDPTGTTTQPISAVALPLPTGAATEATLANILKTSDFNARINTLGQKAMAASTPVVISSDQTAIPISGSVTATNPSIGVDGAAAPTSSTQIGGTDGTNLQSLKAFDIDTGVGNDYNLGVNIRLPASGGSVAGGTSANPLRTDPTGTTTQPISAVALPLPTGAATEGTLGTLLTTNTFIARVNTLGQKTSANSTPVVVASDQTLLVSGTVSAVNVSDGNVNTLAPTIANQMGATDGTNLRVPKAFDLDSGIGIDYNLGVSLRKSSGGGSVELGTAIDPIRIDPTGTTTQPVSISGAVSLPTGASTEATLLLVKAKTDNLDVLLSSRASEATLLLIKDTDGIKKIVDPLPAGTNTLGKVDQGVGGVSAWKVDGSAVTQPVSAASLPLPSGAATSALQTQPGVDIGDVTINNAAGAASVNIQDGGNSITVDGTVAISGSVAVTGPLTDTQLRAAAVPVSGTFFQATQPVSGTITANIGTSGSLALDATLAKLTVTQGAALGTNTQAMVGGSVTTAAPAYTTGQISPLNLTTEGALRTDNSSWFGSTAPTVGSKTSANSIPVVIASDQADVGVKQATAANLNAQVRGAGADAAAVTGNPVLVAGSDGTNARTIRTTTTGLPIVTQNTRVTAGAYAAATGIIIGTVGAQNLMSIENPAASGKNVFIKRIRVSINAGNTARADALVHVGRTTAVPTGGTVLTAQKMATSFGAAVGIIRSIPTATAATGDIDTTMIPITENNTTRPVFSWTWQPMYELEEITLAAGEGVLVRVDASDVDLNFNISVLWQEV